MVPKVNDDNYPQLYKRVGSALDLQKETRSTDFKQAASWEALKEKLVKCALSMSNLQDGGVVIIGVAESDNGYSVDGIDGDLADTFDVDDCTAVLNKYCSPTIELDIVSVSISKKEFVVFQFHGFDEIPIVCRKDHTEWKLRRGDVWNRPRGMARCERVFGEIEMAEIIKTAAFSMARRMIQDSEKIGMRQHQGLSSEDKFAQERGIL